MMRDALGVDLGRRVDLAFEATVLRGLGHGVLDRRRRAERHYGCLRRSELLAQSLDLRLRRGVVRRRLLERREARFRLHRARLRRRELLAQELLGLGCRRRELLAQELLVLGCGRRRLLEEEALDEGLRGRLRRRREQLLAQELALDVVVEAPR